MNLQEDVSRLMEQVSTARQQETIDVSVSSSRPSSRPINRTQSQSSTHPEVPKSANTPSTQSTQSKPGKEKSEKADKPKFNFSIDGFVLSQKVSLNNHATAFGLQFTASMFLFPLLKGMILAIPFQGFVAVIGLAIAFAYYFNRIGLLTTANALLLAYLVFYPFR